MARPYARHQDQSLERNLKMQIPKQALLLRIFIGEDDRLGDVPLYEAIVPTGFGMSSRLHTTKMLRLSEDLPLVIEIIDSEENINMFMPKLEGMMSGGGLVTLEKVQVLRYGEGQAAAP
jgi:PII-like signaling protein